MIISHLLCIVENVDRHSLQCSVSNALKLLQGPYKLRDPMDVASSDDGTDNEARNMRKAEKEAKKLKKEYKAEQKKTQPKNGS